MEVIKMFIDNFLWNWGIIYFIFGEEVFIISKIISVRYLLYGVLISIFYFFLEYMK